jgi:hypothetical protein
VVLALDVELARPRPYDVITSEPFADMKQVVLAHLGLARGRKAAAS